MSSAVRQKTGQALLNASFLLRPFFWASGLFIYFLLRLAEPWRRIRVGMLLHGRIGHLALNTELFLRSLALGKEDKDCLYILFSGRPANWQLLTMLRRRVLVLRLPWLGVFFHEGLEPFVQGTRFFVDIEHRLKSGEYFELNNAPPQLSFSPEEEERGQALLESLGVPRGAPFICFHARDKVYLDVEHSYLTREQWSYHDHRDCDIDNYVPAAESLASRGIYAVRMGQLVEKPISSKNPRVIDYATRHRSDFGDVFLTARCKFFLGNTSGLVALAATFDVPVALANLISLGYPPAHRSSLYIPKKFWDTEKKRFLTFREIIALNLHASEAILSVPSGVRIVENTAEEITALALEMDARIDGTWTPDPGDAEREDRFRRLFPPGSPNNISLSRIGAPFLRANEELLR
jgi:putative glycosyltransferase (TIGR04372 family)